MRSDWIGGLGSEISFTLVMSRAISKHVPDKEHMARKKTTYKLPAIKKFGMAIP